MATKKAAAPKAETKKATAAKAATTCKKAAAKAKTTDFSAENIGFKAGDVYEALAANKGAMTVKEIAKAAKISEEEALLGMGWLLKEGKIKADAEKIKLA